MVNEANSESETLQRPSIASQVERGALVCPVSHSSLVVQDEHLVTPDGRHRYPIRFGVPNLLPDASRENEYASEADGAMVTEYESPKKPWYSFIDKFLSRQGDYRSAASLLAFEEVVVAPSPNALCLAVGGGPQRVHPRLVNVNVGRFPNVDVVGDAYCLPYSDGSVDAIQCEAVLEHLEFPERAVTEMNRVLAVGGEVFAATPFLQGFHAYPNHFQNFTRVGHDRLFERTGLEIVDSGACVGPTFALTDLLAFYLRTYLPGRFLGRLAHRAALGSALLVRPLDRWLHRQSDAELLASTVFLRARKTKATEPLSGSGAESKPRMHPRRSFRLPGRASPEPLRSREPPTRAR